MNTDLAPLHRSPAFHRLPPPEGVQWWVPEGIRITEYLDYCMEQVSVDGLWLEFGVYLGRTIRYMARRHPGPLYGFDSFEGLPEAWEGGPRGDWPKGYFDLGGRVPRLPESNVTLVKGWFHQTLPGFLREHPGPVALLHIDCDLYRSTQQVLDALVSRLVPGSIILFDEFYNYPGFTEHEFRAFSELVERHGIEFRYLAHVADDIRAAVRIEANPAAAVP
ncbi:MAG: TylF/MycF/NovP-related O-methyltransferase [Myxococcota bacterium]